MDITTVLSFKRTVCVIVAIIIILAYVPASYGTHLNQLDPSAYIDSEQIYRYALELESLTLNPGISLYSYRSSGSQGAKAAAYWIANNMRELGLRVKVERFYFLTWELIDKPSLTLYVDSEPFELKSFVPLHLSWPTPIKGLRKEITIYGQDKMKDHILVIGIDELAVKGGLVNLSDWIKTREPKAVLYTYFNSYSKWKPQLSSSAEGKNYWDIEAPAGWILYDDWLKIKQALKTGKRVEAEIEIPARITYGPHYNVLGDLDGIRQDRMFIVSAHYDTVMSPGFIDNGSGIAGMLAIAKALAESYEAGYKPLFNVRFVFFTAEELGLLGSLNYISEHSEEHTQVIGVINLDSIGGLRLKVIKSSSILDELAEKAADELNVPLTRGYHLFSFIDMFERSSKQTGADHLPFEDPEAALRLSEAEWPGLRLLINTNINVPAITISSRPIFTSYIGTGEKPGWIHTPYDKSSTPEWVDKDQLERHVKVSALTMFKALWTALVNETLVSSSQLQYQLSPIQVTQAFSSLIGKWKFHTFNSVRVT